jgi:hypothetical protein
LTEYQGSWSFLESVTKLELGNEGRLELGNGGGWSLVMREQLTASFASVLTKSHDKIMAKPD